MRFYAHRGNVNGRNPEQENTLPYLCTALSQGYGVEVDVRWNGKDYILGHDEGSKTVSLEFLRSDRVLTHAKNVPTFSSLLKFHEINTFYQNDESVVLSSKGNLIHHSRYPFDLTEKSIPVFLGTSYVHVPQCTNLAGIISDYVSHYGKKDLGFPRCFKLLALDVDGVLTNGRKIYDAEHRPVYKEFNDRDFTAIKRFAAAGIPTILISGDLAINGGMATIRGLPLLDSRKDNFTLDKSKLLDTICKQYAIAPQDIAFVGDDYYDLSMVENLNWTYCPQDAAQVIQRRVKKVIPRNGGDGVIEWLYEYLAESGLITGAFPYE